MYLFAFEKSPLAIKYIPSEFQTKHMAKKAVLVDYYYTINYIANRFLNNKFYLFAFNKNPSVFKYIPDKFKTKEMVKKALIYNYNDAIYNIPSRLRDKEINDFVDKVYADRSL